MDQVMTYEREPHEILALVHDITALCDILANGSERAFGIVLIACDLRGERLIYDARGVSNEEIVDTVQRLLATLKKQKRKGPNERTNQESTTQGRDDHGPAT